jgi:hypothetical protein
MTAYHSITSSPASYGRASFTSEHLRKQELLEFRNESKSSGGFTQLKSQVHPLLEPSVSCCRLVRIRWMVPLADSEGVNSAFEILARNHR